MRRALPLALLCLGLLAPASAQAAFGFLSGGEGFSVSATKEDGSPDLAAGSHPYELTTKVALDPGGQGDLRELHLAMPPGLIENPSAVEQCQGAQFATPRTSPYQASLSGEDCPNRSQVGTVTVKASFGGEVTRTFGLFNLAPPPGFPSELGASPFGIPIVLSPHLREEGTANVLSSRLEAGAVDESRAVDVEIPAGGISVHDPFLVHGSNPNHSPRRRCGLTIRYIPTTTRITREWKSFLLRGEDHFGRNPYHPFPPYREADHFPFRDLPTYRGGIAASPGG